MIKYNSLLKIYYEQSKYMYFGKCTLLQHNLLYLIYINISLFQNVQNNVFLTKILVALLLPSNFFKTARIWNKYQQTNILNSSHCKGIHESALQTKVFTTVITGYVLVHYMSLCVFKSSYHNE